MAVGTSAFSDELLRQLIAVGQVDVMVGIPTHNNAATIVEVVKGVQEAFVRSFARDRTVLITLDGGSTDGTTERLREATARSAATLTASHGLRTAHQVNAPYHGVPGKGSALRVLFAAADLLQTRAVVVVAPDLTSLTPEWIESLARPVLSGLYDFVSPTWVRHPLDAPLVTQITRPVMRAVYGTDVHEPLASEFGCSRRFAADCLAEPVWNDELARSGIDLWLTATALAHGFRVGEVALGLRTQAPGHARLPLADLFSQVVGALFSCLEMHASAWRRAPAVVPASTALRTSEAPPPPAVDTAQLIESFKRDVATIRPVLGQLLTNTTLARVLDLARLEIGHFAYPDDLWAETVYEFAASYHRSVMRRQHITQALVPLYLGRLASFAAAYAGHPASAVEQGLEALCQQYERALPRLADCWNQMDSR